jgi:hypothetical protein
MERLVEDLEPAVVKTCITLNRHLADRGVLAEIKAALRAAATCVRRTTASCCRCSRRCCRRPARPPRHRRSTWRCPRSTKLRSAQPALVFVEKEGSPRAASPADAPGPPPAVPPVPAEVARALYSAFARHLERSAAAPTASADDTAFPQLDSLMALGSASAMIAALDQWQRFDPETELAADTASADATLQSLLPLNRLPLIRNALAARIANPADRMTMDVVALIFDYIFRDPSIPKAQRRVFARLQVPIAKAALLDRSFFSDRNHPARRLLDDLAAAAVGAQGNDDYRTAFDALAREIVDRIAANFGVDVVFEAADAEIRPFALHEQTVAAVALHDDIDTALRRRGVRCRPRRGPGAAARQARRPRRPVRRAQLHRDALPTT